MHLLQIRCLGGQSYLNRFCSKSLCKKNVFKMLFWKKFSTVKLWISLGGANYSWDDMTSFCLNDDHLDKKKQWYSLFNSYRIMVWNHCHTQNVYAKLIYKKSNLYRSMLYVCCLDRMPLLSKRTLTHIFRANGQSNPCQLDCSHSALKVEC